MSLHNDPNYQIPALVAALKHHCLTHDAPSQLADSFRTGWVAAIAAAPAQPVAVPAEPVAQVTVSDDDLDMGFSESFISGEIRLPNGTHDLFTAGQMLAYVAADRAARGAAQSAECGNCFDGETDRGHTCRKCGGTGVAQALDAERYRWLREYAIGAYITAQGKGSTAIYLLTKVPALGGIGEETDTAIDAARAAQEGKHD